MYSNRSEEEEALVFHNLYPCTHFDRFGIKGIRKLKWVFYFIISMTSEHQTNLLDGRDDRNGLRNIIDGLDSEDRHKMRPALENNSDNPIAFSMKISAKNLNTYPQLKLMQHGVDVN